MNRVQRKRTKGFKLPLKTKCINRGTKWGNPWRIVEGPSKRFWHIMNQDNRIIASRPDKLMALKICLAMYEAWVVARIQSKKLSLSDFDGYENIACFCPADQPCHGDVIIELLEKENKG